MEKKLADDLDRLSDKLILASRILTPKILEDSESFAAYTAVCEAQAVLWTIADDRQRDLERMAQELEAKLVERGW